MCLCNAAWSVLCQDQGKYENFTRSGSGPSGLYTQSLRHVVQSAAWEQELKRKCGALKAEMCSETSLLKVSQAAKPRYCQTTCKQGHRRPGFGTSCCTWWRHHFEAFFCVAGPCGGSSPVTCVIISQRAGNADLDVGLHKLLNKQSNDRWFETTLHSCDVAVMNPLFLRVLQLSSPQRHLRWQVCPWYPRPKKLEEPHQPMHLGLD